MTYEQRYLRTRPPVVIDARQVKRYNVTIAEDPIDASLQEAADAYTAGLLAERDETVPAAFSVLHLGRDMVFLNAYTWVWDNVVHCRTAIAPISAPTTFEELTKPWIGCVWELAPFAHERGAWVRHMRRPAEPSLDAYLQDTMPEGWFD